MKSTLFLCLTLWAAAPRSDAGDPLSSPEVKAVLQPVCTARLPNVEDAKPVVDGLTKLAAKRPAAEKKQIEALAAQLKTVLALEHGLVQAKAALKDLPVLQRAVEDAARKLEITNNTPATDANHRLDLNKWSFWKRRDTEKLVFAKEALAKVQRAPADTAAALVKQLATTDSDIATHLREKRRDAVVALASCLHAARIRNGLTLEFQPRVSWTWVSLSKLAPEKVTMAREMARKELLGWIANHMAAKEITETGRQAIQQIRKSDDLLTDVLTAGGVTLTGVALEKEMERRIEGCLEIIFFAPEPNADTGKMLTALQTIVTGRNPGESVAGRFTKVAVQEALAKVSPELGTNVKVVDELTGIFSNLSGK